MSRPSARRRPTALRLTESDQQYVLVASCATFAAFACFAYVYNYVHASEEQYLSILTSSLLSSGVLLCGSAIQRLAFPVGGPAIPIQAPSLQQVSPIICKAFSMLGRILVIHCLGIERSIAMLLPMESLLHAYHTGSLSKQGSARSFLVVAMVLSAITDIVSSTSASSVILGYFFLATTGILAALSQAHPKSTTGLDIWSGLVLLMLGSSSCLMTLASWPPLSLLDIVAVAAGIGSRAWRPTQSKAISTALSFAWPCVVGTLVFFGFNLSHNVSWSQLISFGVLYCSLNSIVQTRASSASQTAANGTPNQVSKSYMTYYISEIVRDKESRDIFYFLLLNLSFMVIQMLYGIWTNSLGLISDSIHMFFDCLALAVGLVAAVMSKWPASQNHPFGFAKVEIISGFANGIFLVLISISIMIEAFERLMEPPEMKTDQLLLISVLGLCVNLVGIFAFNHGHHHHHHGHSHSHEHGSEHKAKVEPLPTIHTPKLTKSNGTFDSATGLRSPMPDFSNFAGFESPRMSSEAPAILSSAQDSVRTPSNWPILDSDDHLPSQRSRSPIRRPGSPLKFSHDVVLPDVAEDSDDISDRSSDADLSNRNSLHAHVGKIAHNHKHSSVDGHAHDHDAKPKDSHEAGHGHTHSRNLSYDLTAEHSHVRNSCSDHAHHHHDHGHDHAHKTGHDHSHNMEGIFLHILADTLGSGGVIVSTLLIRFFGWTGFDPLASIFIAVLIFLSVIPLLKSSFTDLLLTLQDDQEYVLREVLGDVSLISGVDGIPFIRFWVDGNQKMHGILTIRAGIDGDTDVVRQKVRRKLQDGVPNLADIIVQVDRQE